MANPPLWQWLGWPSVYVILFFFSELFFHVRLTVACPVTTDSEAKSTEVIRPPAETYMCANCFLTTRSTDAHGLTKVTISCCAYPSDSYCILYFYFSMVVLQITRSIGPTFSRPNLSCCYPRPFVVHGRKCNHASIM